MGGEPGGGGGGGGGSPALPPIVHHKPKTLAPIPDGKPTKFHNGKPSKFQLGARTVMPTIVSEGGTVIDVVVDAARGRIRETRRASSEANLRYQRAGAYTRPLFSST